MEFTADIYIHMNFSSEIQVKQLPPYKKGEETLKASLNYVCFISPTVPGNEPKQSW